MKKSPPTKQWNNQSNRRVYEQPDIAEKIQVFANEAGMNEYPDIKAIEPLLQQAHMILEVGAGYGRVIEGLLQAGVTAHITAVEQSNYFYQKMISRFDSTKLSIIHENILKYATRERYDLILWLWSGCMDFTPAEQIDVLQKLKALLAPNGKLLVDIIDRAPANTTLYHDQYCEIKMSETVKYITHLITPKTAAPIIKKAGLQIEREIRYFTKKKLERVILVLTT